MSSRVLRSSIKENCDNEGPITRTQKRRQRTFSVIPETSCSIPKVSARHSVQVKKPNHIISHEKVQSLKFDSSLPNVIKQSNNSHDSGLNFSDIEIVGRKGEIQMLSTFIQSCFNEQKSASAYISGAPGTGKTAVVLYVTKQFKNANNCDVVVINCMQLSSCSEIYSRIAAELCSSIKNKDVSISSSVELENWLNVHFKKRNIILILDEIDQLSSRGQDVLYKIFEWPVKLNCCILILGIANALDLPERLLPRIKARSYKPIHIVFGTYSQDDIVDIVQAQLRRISTNLTIQPFAVQLCARKIAASTGDVRTALDVCRRAIDLAHLEARSKNESTNTSTQEFDHPVALTIQHIGLALKNAQASTSRSISNSSENSNSFTNTELPLHHKLLLASCMLLRRQKCMRELPFSQLYETYRLICKKKEIMNLEESELSAVCELLDSRGFVQFTGPGNTCETKLLGTPARMRRIKLRLDDLGVEQALKDDLLLSTVMSMTLN